MLLQRFIFLYRLRKLNQTNIGIILGPNPELYEISSSEMTPLNFPELELGNSRVVTSNYIAIFQSWDFSNKVIVNLKDKTCKAIEVDYPVNYMFSDKYFQTTSLTSKKGSLYSINESSDVEYIREFYYYNSYFVTGPTDYFFRYDENKRELIYEDLKNGVVHWKYQFELEIRKVDYLKNQNSVIVLSGDFSGSVIVCIDVSNGEKIWKVELPYVNAFYDNHDQKYCTYEYLVLNKYSIEDGSCSFLNLQIDKGITIVGADESYLFYRSIRRIPKDPRFGKINKQSGIIEWEYILRNDKDEIIMPHEWIQLENGHQVITSTDPVKQTYIFDPDHPDNIPYRTISNGVHIHKNNPFYKPK